MRTLTTGLTARLTALVAASLVAASALAPAQAADEPFRTLVIGTDIAPGFAWVSGGGAPCSIASNGSMSFSTAQNPNLITVPTSGELEVEGCGTITSVKNLPRKPRKVIRGEGDFVVGAHVFANSVYKPSLGPDAFLDTVADECGWGAFTSIKAAEDAFIFTEKKGPLRVGPKTKAVVLEGDCVWKRVR